MPSALSYPGVYVEEIPSGVRTISGVSTSTTAFVDFFTRGPMNVPQRVTGFADFERVFGGLDARSPASYGIRQFYLNGGAVAFVVRTAAANTATRAQIALTATAGSARPVTYLAEAADEGAWGRGLQVAVDHRTVPDPATGQPDPGTFNLVVREVVTTGGRSQVTRSEVLRNLSISSSSPRSAVPTVAAESRMIRLIDRGPGVRPDATATTELPDVTDPVLVGDPQTGVRTLASGYTNPRWLFRSYADTSAEVLDDGSRPTDGVDGNPPGSTEILAGLATLDRIAPEVFNILCLPRAAELDAASTTFDTPNLRSVVEDAIVFCRDRRAFMIVDIPWFVDTPAKMRTWMDTNANVRDRNAAVYFPRLLMRDPLAEGRDRNVGASGTLAGLYAATDAARGVWKAPAGTEAGIVGARLAATMTDLENGSLNPFGINALRTFPVFGDVAWGARTLDGADIQASEWKYVPVRRTALFLEESLFQGLKWVVFEPNDETLWSQIRLNVGAFLHTLFRQGAFAGDTPAKAYFVRCDAETTTQNDVDRGVVNVAVGFAPLRPAEFVVLQIQQIAGQIQV